MEVAEIGDILLVEHPVLLQEHHPVRTNLGRLCWAPS
jgi:hypothetical protein